VFLGCCLASVESTDHLHQCNVCRSLPCSLWSPAESTQPLILLLAHEQFTDCNRDSSDDLNL
jgi:hypothetical protein